MVLHFLFMIFQNFIYERGLTVQGIMPAFLKESLKTVLDQIQFLLRFANLLLLFDDECKSVF